MASRTHWSVYFWNAAPRVSLMLIATFAVPSGCGQPATNQSSAFTGSVPLMNHSVDEKGESADGASPEPYPPNAPGAVTTVPLTTFAGRGQSVAGGSARASFM